MKYFTVYLVDKTSSQKKISATCTFGDTVQDILDKTNEYRSPLNQIEEVTNKYGVVIPLDLQIKEEMTFYFEIKNI